MKRKKKLTIAAVTSSLAVLSVGVISAPGEDKYDLKVPGGLAFSEFSGYESWETISISQNDRVMAVIVGNPAMIEAYRAGIPGNGQPVPDGAMMAKVHWTPEKSQYPGNPAVPAALVNVDFMVKDSKRFADSGGWGYAVFDYEAASDTYRPGDLQSFPPQGNDAKCGFACHTIVRSRDYVFTEYAPR
jgi:Cytochrome P460